MSRAPCNIRPWPYFCANSTNKRAYFWRRGPPERSHDTSQSNLFAPSNFCGLNLRVACSAPPCGGILRRTVCAIMCDPFCKIILLQKLLFWDIFGFFAPAMDLHPRVRRVPAVRAAHGSPAFQAGRRRAVLLACAAARTIHYAPLVFIIVSTSSSCSMCPSPTLWPPNLTLFPQIIPYLNSLRILR